AVDRPIIIVGTGRCGSTMLHRVLALHEDAGWLSTFNEVFPTQHWLSSFSNLYRARGLSRKIRHLTAFPKPFECYRFWEHYLPGFSRRERPQTPEDVEDERIEPVRRAIASVLRWQRRSRLVAKVTGWSRMAYFDRIFPDARFVWLNREHRSVVSSWVKAGWLDVTSGLDEDSWQWGDVPTRYEELWRTLGGGPLLSAALKIKLDLDDIRHNASLLPGRCIKIEYEDLTRNPMTAVRSICEFVDLPWTTAFARRVAAIPMYDTTNKWRKHMTEEEGDLILDFFRRAEMERPVSAPVG
ncbi:MAG TPA: sulfotransferase, partial [Alphaproteobacteria bacterium]|nr:sulfotransferase [Alphaproteobacteria bacterium]